MSSDILSQRKLGHGDILFMQGDEANHLYIVHSGEVEVTRQGPDGLHDIERTAQAGDVVGEIALSASQAYDTGARANGPSSVVVIERRKLLALLKKEDKFVSALFRILVQNLLSVMDHKNEAEQLKAEAEAALANLAEDEETDDDNDVADQRP